MKKLLIGFLLLTAVSAFGQTRQAFLDAAETAFESKDYYSALHYYKTVQEFGQEDIAARVDRALVKLADVVGPLDVPQFRRLSCGQPHVEKIGARGAVGQKPVATRQQTIECIAHDYAFQRRSRGAGACPRRGCATPTGPGATGAPPVRVRFPS